MKPRVIYFLMLALSFAWTRPVSRVADRRSFFHRQYANNNRRGSTQSLETTTLAKENSSSLAKRRKHTNKYENHSQKASDPLIVAMEMQNSHKQNLHEETRITGTTVPNSLGSNNVNTMNQNFKFGNRLDGKAVVPSDPFTFGFTEIGHIVGAHGVHGQLKVQLNTDFAEYHVRNNSIWYVKKPSRRSPRPVRIISGSKTTDNSFIVHFEGVKSRLTASLLQKYKLFVKSFQRPILAEEEYLLRDIVGLRCYYSVEDLRRGRFFATVEGVVPPDELVDISLQHKMHSMIELRFRGTEKYCLVPFVPSIVTNVMLDDKALIVEPPVGLLEMTYESDQKVIVRGYLPSRISWLSEKDRQILMNTSIRMFGEGGAVVPE